MDSRVEIRAFQGWSSLPDAVAGADVVRSLYSRYEMKHYRNRAWVEVFNLHEMQDFSMIPDTRALHEHNVLGISPSLTSPILPQISRRATRAHRVCRGRRASSDPSQFLLRAIVQVLAERVLTGIARGQPPSTLRGLREMQE
jgi:hypothetical protein